MKTYQLIVTGDTNDADYTTSISYFEEGEEVELYRDYDDNDSSYFVKYIDLINKAIAALDGCKEWHNWGVGEYCRDNESPDNLYHGILSDTELDFLRDIFPNGVHSITTIELNEVSKLDTIFRRKRVY